MPGGIDGDDEGAGLYVRGDGRDCCDDQCGADCFSDAGSDGAIESAVCRGAGLVGRGCSRPA